MSRPQMFSITFERIPGRPDGPIPARATDQAACFDIASAARVQLRRGTVVLVPTGLRMRAPPGTFIEVRPRSGLSAQGVLMVNAPGTIDRDYAGEVKVPFTFLGRGTYTIERGDRIAQLRLATDHDVRFRLGRVSEVSSRQGGFGSTGR